MTRATCHRVSETALLFTAPPWAESNGALLDSQTILDPLLDRSLLQRAVEHLVRIGSRHLMVVLGDNAAEIRDFLKQGERWGCRISYHYPDPRAPMRQFLKAIGIAALEHYRVGNAWSIAPLAINADSTPHGAGSTLHWQDADAARWTGWGCLSGAWLLSRDIPADPVALGASIAADESLEKSLVVPTLLADTPANLIDGVQRLLNEDSAAVYKAAQAKIHSTVRLTAPCHIGRAVNIEAGAVIGPHAVLEDGAFVAAGAQVRHSLVMQGTYVGPELELDHVIVRGPVLVNAVLGSRTEITDPQILSHLRPASRKIDSRSRVIAAALQVALLPLYLLLRRQRHCPAGETIISCPSNHGRGLAALRLALQCPLRAVPDAPYDWGRHFVATFYPGLAAVRRGELRLIGPTLKSWHETKKLPDEWRRIHEECFCGLLNDAWVHIVPASGRDDAFASDALAAAHPESPGLIARYLSPYLRNVWQAMFDKRFMQTTPPTPANAV
ncbi:MAG: hypothetical protein Q8M20_08470 [Rhodocyclaceae bacterium]|nr:hypothetical protein [Rhodocyclaceae bacterium]MDZ4216506.1 hypothetical protein [Rhodocyclaceae bacterium]